MTFQLGKRSRKRLEGVHPDLIAVLELAIERTPIDFTVLEGLRTLERQKQLVANGSSTTMNSRHLTGHAIDIAPLDDGDVSWAWPLYHKLAPVVKQAAEDLGVAIEWGGDWTSFKDGPHWQLSWGEYGKHDMGVRHRPIDAPDPDPASQEPPKPSGLAAFIAFLKGWLK